MFVDNLDVVRFIRTQLQQILRDRIGNFSSTKVALQVQILYGGHTAIEGHVQTLKGFNPATEIVTLTKPQHSISEVPGTVQAGRKLAGPVPYYPETARNNRIGGSVVLLASINEIGEVTVLTPIASPDPLLTASAIEAVMKWKYEPYRLNGKPTQVDTPITINFSINRN